MPGVRSPLAGRVAGDIDFFVVRENTCSIEASCLRPVTQETVMSRIGVDSILALLLVSSRDLLARFLLMVPGRAIVRREQNGRSERLFVLAVMTRLRINRGH